MAAQAAYATATRRPVPEDTQKAELDVAQAKSNLDLNNSIVKNRKQLFDQGAIPGRDLDTAQTALVQAQAGLQLHSQTSRIGPQRQPRSSSQVGRRPAHLR